MVKLFLIQALQFVWVPYDPGGGVIWEFLGGMCRWDPGTLGLYQS